MTILDRAARVEQASNLMKQKDAELQGLAAIGAKVLEEQKKADIYKKIDEAHTAGVDDGLAAAMRKFGLYN